MELFTWMVVGVEGVAGWAEVGSGLCKDAEWRRKLAIGLPKPPGAALFSSTGRSDCSVVAAKEVLVGEEGNGHHFLRKLTIMSTTVVENSHLKSQPSVIVKASSSSVMDTVFVSGRKTGHFLSARAVSTSDGHRIWSSSASDLRMSHVPHSISGKYDGH